MVQVLNKTTEISSLLIIIRVDLRVDWRTFRVFQNDRKLLDLATIYGEAFPLDPSMQDLNLQKKLLRWGPFGGRTRTKVKKHLKKKQVNRSLSEHEEKTQKNGMILMEPVTSESEEDIESPEEGRDSPLKSVRVEENERPPIINLYLRKHEGERTPGGIPFRIHPEQVVHNNNCSFLLNRLLLQLNRRNKLCTLFNYI